MTIDYMLPWKSISRPNSPKQAQMTKSSMNSWIRCCRSNKDNKDFQTFKRDHKGDIIAMIEAEPTGLNFCFVPVRDHAAVGLAGRSYYMISFSSTDDDDDDKKVFVNLWHTDMDSEDLFDGCDGMKTEDRSHIRLRIPQDWESLCADDAACDNVFVSI